MHRAQAHPSKLCNDRWEEHCHDVHKEKLATVKASVDNKTPKAHSHLNSRRKKNQLAEERLSTIEKHNLILLDKMMHIMKSPTKIDNQNDMSRRSLNDEKRRREANRINKENEAILKKLTGAKPYYDRTDWSDFQENQTKYLSSISEYPVIVPGSRKPTAAEEEFPDERGAFLYESAPKYSTKLKASYDSSLRNGGRKSPNSTSPVPQREKTRLPPLSKKPLASAPAKKKTAKDDTKKQHYSDDDSLSFSDFEEDSGSEEEPKMSKSTITSSQKTDRSESARKDERDSDEDSHSDLSSNSDDDHDEIASQKPSSARRESPRLGSESSLRSSKSSEKSPLSNRSQKSLQSSRSGDKESVASSTKKEKNESEDDDNLSDDLGDLSD